MNPKPYSPGRKPKERGGVFTSGKGGGDETRATKPCGEQSGAIEEEGKRVFRGFSTRAIVHRAHDVCELRWICIDDLFCFFSTLPRCRSSGVDSRCACAYETGGASVSPLLLSTVPLLVGSVRLRRMLPPTDCTGLPGASATGDRSLLGMPSVRVPCTTELKTGESFSYKTRGGEAYRLTAVLLCYRPPSRKSLLFHPGDKLPGSTI